MANCFSIRSYGAVSLQDWWVHAPVWVSLHNPMDTWGAASDTTSRILQFEFSHARLELQSASKSPYRIVALAAFPNYVEFHS